MPHRLILKVTEFQLPPPKRLGTVVKNILGGHHGPPMSNRVKGTCYGNKTIHQIGATILALKLDKGSAGWGGDNHLPPPTEQILTYFSNHEDDVQS